MSRIAPPAPPCRVALDDDNRFDRTQFLVRQFWLTAITLFLTIWCFTLGPLPGILAVVVAKHVLVAILVMGLGVDARQEAETD